MNTTSKYDLTLIVHGCPADANSVLPHDKRWMNWLEKELKKRGLNAIAPDMPTPWQPTYEHWKKAFEQFPITKNTMLIGHSCGGAFLVRWLLDTGKTVKKLILVAPAKVPETIDNRKDLYDFKLPADAPNIAQEIVIFISNDREHLMKSFEVYKNALKPRVVQLENKGHFLIFTMGTNAFPELLEEVLR